MRTPFPLFGGHSWAWSQGCYQGCLSFRKRWCLHLISENEQALSSWTWYFISPLRMGCQGELRSNQWEHIDWSCFLACHWYHGWIHILIFLLSDTNSPRWQVRSIWDGIAQCFSRVVNEKILVPTCYGLAWFSLPPPPPNAQHLRMLTTFLR